jgi:hypothetical protein
MARELVSPLPVQRENGRHGWPTFLQHHRRTVLVDEDAMLPPSLVIGEP